MTGARADLPVLDDVGPCWSQSQDDDLRKAGAFFPEAWGMAGSSAPGESKHKLHEYGGATLGPG